VIREKGSPFLAKVNLALRSLQTSTAYIFLVMVSIFSLIANEILAGVFLRSNHTRGSRSYHEADSFFNYICWFSNPSVAINDLTHNIKCDEHHFFRLLQVVDKALIYLSNSETSSL
jgi:hypothetical protein